MGFQIGYKVPIAALWLVERMIDKKPIWEPFWIRTVGKNRAPRRNPE